jgi:hypothetical protein
LYGRFRAILIANLSSDWWVESSVAESDGIRPISIIILAANSQSLKTGSDNGHYLELGMEKKDREGNPRFLLYSVISIASV